MSRSKPEVGEIWVHKNEAIEVLVTRITGGPPFTSLIYAGGEVYSQNEFVNTFKFYKTLHNPMEV